MWTDSYFVAKIILFLYFLRNVRCDIGSVTEVIVDSKARVANLDYFWKSTGLCPPDPKEDIYKFLLSDEEKFNLALIGALPYKGIKQVRIHWLFDLIFRNPGEENYNFTYLDELTEFLIKHNLTPGFELMGYPMKPNSTFLSNFESFDAIDQKFWENLVGQIGKRYVETFGAEEVSTWKFETWNEPDLQDYNLLNFTLPEYMQYINGCVEGLKNAFSGETVGVTLGGPAGLFREENHPLCWGLLEACNSLQRSQCPIQFISFHRKGDGTAQGVLNGTLELLDLLHNKFPNLIEIPIANDESDIITTWSNSWEWLGDARYAAMVVKVIADHYKSIVLDRKLKIEVLSNDNGFLNYHPFYFTQRTLFARFQMNHTDPPHNQFIKKPVYSVMALLSFLGDEYLKEEINSDDPLLTTMATRTLHANQSVIAIILGYSDNDQVNTQSEKSVKLTINNLSVGSRFVVYLLDNIDTNPYFEWQRHGSPVFPSKHIRKSLRDVEEPSRLQDPRDFYTENLNITVNLTIPSVALIHICSKPEAVPGPVRNLQIFNVTGNEVLLTWSDNEVNTKCIRTYEVEFESKCNNSLEFVRVNPKDTIFLSYHHAATGDGACEATIGRYRVRAVNYWDQPGHYSEIISYP